jgi:hypothetical protein
MYPAGQQVKNCCPPRPAAYINKQNGGTTHKFINYTIFQVCVQIKNVKEKKNTHGQATGYAVEAVYVDSFKFKLVYTAAVVL